MARTRIAPETGARAPLRLRVPDGLAVALLGASTTVALTFGGCNDEPTPDPLDAGQISKYQDAGVTDSRTAASTDARTDAGEELPLVDGGVDSTPDAELVPVDAYVPPDTLAGLRA